MLKQVIKKLVPSKPLRFQPPKRIRILTAEGWKRMAMKKSRKS